MADRPFVMAQRRPRALPSLLNTKLKILFLSLRLLPVRDRPSSTGAAQWGPVREVRVVRLIRVIMLKTRVHYFLKFPDGPGQAVITEGGAGGRGAGQAEARVNGMPSKKSNSTSKLSAKG